MLKKKFIDNLVLFYYFLNFWKLNFKLLKFRKIFYYSGLKHNNFLALSISDRRFFSSLKLGESKGAFILLYFNFFVKKKFKKKFKKKIRFLYYFNCLQKKVMLFCCFNVVTILPLNLLIVQSRQQQKSLFLFDFINFLKFFNSFFFNFNNFFFNLRNFFFFVLF